MNRFADVTDVEGISAMNDDEFGQSIHQRLLASDPVAPEELVSRWLEPLVAELTRAFPEVAHRDPTLIRDAVTDSLLEYAQRPSIYRPELSRLRTFLFHAARGDLLNALERRQRRKAIEQTLESVEDLVDSRNDLWEGSEVVEDVADAIDEGARWETYRVMLAQHFPDERDRQIVALLIDGERKTERYAAVLGLDHLDRDSQQREVKRNKDRIVKRLRRLGVKLRERA